MKAPAVQWYFGDWLRCAEVRLCSLEARGLWIDMLGFMHQATPYGHLVFDGKAVDARRLANMVGGGASPAKVSSLLKELGENGVFSKNGQGIIYCRRMVKDEEKREAWRSEKQGQRSKPRTKDGHGCGQPPDSGADTLPLSADCPPVLHSSVLHSSPRVDGVDENTSGNGQPVDKPPGDMPGNGHTNAKGTGWWRTDDGIVAEGKRLGIPARTGESMQAYKQRLFEHRKASATTTP